MTNYQALCAQFADAVDLLVASAGERQIFSSRIEALVALAAEARTALETQP